MLLPVSLSSASIPDSITSFVKPMASSFLNDNLVELYSPTYFFPIIGVLLSGLTVYIFGFTKTTKNPPTLQLFAYEKDDRKTHHLSSKKERKRDKDGSNVESLKKSKLTLTQKPSEDKLKNSVKKAANKKPLVSEKPSKSEQSEKRPNKALKTRKTESSSKKANEVLDTSTIDVSIGDGQWVEAISRKKSRKLKEGAKSEAKKQTSENGKTMAKQSADSNGLASPSSKKLKAKVSESKGGLLKTDVPNSKQGVKDIADANKTEHLEKKTSNVLHQSPKSERALSSDALDKGLTLEDPDQYAYTKELRVTKKKEKLLQSKNRRASETTKNSSLNHSVIENHDVSNNVNNNDKLTAAILANYGNGTTQVDYKPKKKSMQTQPEANRETENKTDSVRVIESNDVNGVGNKIQADANEKRTPASKVEAVGAAVHIENGDLNGLKSELKVAANKKPRARRE